MDLHEVLIFVIQIACLYFAYHVSSKVDKGFSEIRYDFTVLSNRRDQRQQPASCYLVRAMSSKLDSLLKAVQSFGIQTQGRPDRVPFGDFSNRGFSNYSSFRSARSGRPDWSNRVQPFDAADPVPESPRPVRPNPDPPNQPDPVNPRPPEPANSWRRHQPRTDEEWSSLGYIKISLDDLIQQGGKVYLQNTEKLKNSSKDNNNSNNIGKPEAKIVCKFVREEEEKEMKEIEVTKRIPPDISPVN